MRVLVATDLSRGSDVALREGIERTSATGELAVVHVVPQRTTTLVSRAMQLVGKYVAAHTSRPVDMFVDDGPEYAQIVRRAEAWHADLIVLGSHGHSRLPRILGGVTEEVVRHAPCDVLVARPSGHRGRVLAATDLSDPTLPVVMAGRREADRLDADLEVVHVIGFLEVEIAYLLSPSEITSLPDTDFARRTLEASVGKLSIEAEMKILDSPTAAAIVEEADGIEAELVVVGSHARTGLARLTLGRTAEKVLRAASCSVFLVRLN